MKNLEKRDDHFVFELLRNADDNHFTKARSRKEDLFVTFKIAPSYIIVDCNEDGFTPENVRAICAVGKSSKVNRPQYFGEEGIGFKSIFTVAYKVHIQSGCYSFSFSHRCGQSGMGMVSPTWEEPGDGLPAGITRMKLFLHPKINQAANNQSVKLFEEIQETHLLFLRNIECINIVRLTEGDVITSTKKFLIRRDTVHIMAVATGTGGVANPEDIYYVSKYLIRDLPRDKHRTVPKIQTTAEEGLSASEVVLAFPLDTAQSNPVLDTQQVFSFSSIGNFGFKVSSRP
jgi:hypothetical protein